MWIFRPRGVAFAAYAAAVLVAAPSAGLAVYPGG